MGMLKARVIPSDIRETEVILLSQILSRERSDGRVTTFQWR
jgi:hypothetical protein